ncbi:pyrimidine-specific ribonucleoside hydrolase, partial [Haematococcus lacustris]
GPMQEFNCQVDPEAAKMVFDCGVALVMVPLDVTHTVLVTPSVLQRVRIVYCRVASMRQDTYRSVFGFIHPPLHDPCAVAFVIAPHLFKVRELRVDIETVSPYTAGQTVCDVWRQTGRPANCRVAVTMDVAQFWDLQLAALAEADVASPLNMLTIPKGG